ncbi:hypothetical protein [Chromobacterium vaccinii]|nr:hypothetical protein [Chromobacterium vaccinii]
MREFLVWVLGSEAVGTLAGKGNGWAVALILVLVIALIFIWRVKKVEFK